MSHSSLYALGTTTVALYYVHRWLGVALNAMEFAMTIVRFLLVVLIANAAVACGPSPSNDPSKLGKPQPVSVPQ